MNMEMAPSLHHTKCNFTFFCGMCKRPKKLAEKVSQNGSACMSKTLQRHESVVCLGLNQGN